MVKAASLDSKAAQQEDPEHQSTTRKPFTAGWERLLQVSGRLNKQG
jgi:hypothetical protein